MDANPASKIIVCKLTTPELQDRKKTVIRELKALVIERVEMVDGVKYKFEGSDATIDLVASFIKTERLCCDFFDFKMDISSKRELWLEMKGPAGTTEFISKEMGF